MILKFHQFISESGTKNTRSKKSKSKKKEVCNECRKKMDECYCQDCGGGYLGAEMPSNLLY